MTYLCYIAAVLGLWIICHIIGYPISKLNDADYIIFAILTAAELMRLEIAVLHKRR